MPLNGDANASQEKVEKLAGPLLEEYLHIKVTNIQIFHKNAKICRINLKQFWDGLEQIPTTQNF